MAREKWHDRLSGLSILPGFGRERVENGPLRFGTEVARLMTETGVFAADPFLFRPKSLIMAAD
jgi:hypothetical protein